jgi:hypothetical protein
MRDMDWSYSTEELVLGKMKLVPHSQNRVLTRAPNESARLLAVVNVARRSTDLGRDLIRALVCAS